MGRQTRSIQAIRQDFQASLSWTVASAAAAVGPITKRRGEEHSLSSFQARDLEFRRLYFLSHPPPSVTLSGSELTANGSSNDPYANRFGSMVITEDDVENEFWRLVQSPTETVEVEYGADVHSTTHGRYVGS